MSDEFHKAALQELDALNKQQAFVDVIKKQLELPRDIQNAMAELKRQLAIPNEAQNAWERLKNQIAVPAGFQKALNDLKHQQNTSNEMRQAMTELRQQLAVPKEFQAFSDSLEALRISLLGKKGLISERMSSLGKLTPEERRIAGAELNHLKEEVSDALAARKTMLEEVALDARLESEKVDITLGVRHELRGSVHPVSQVWEEVVQIFGDLGFSVAEGPHIEDDFHNFDALNMPPEHPARQEHDTFYFNEREDGSRMVLRTHTSPVQIRTMLSQKPPIRIIAPGRTFRSDSDMTHTPMFNQVEALVIDETTHMGNLKWVLHEFCKAFFEVDDVKMRFRASHFPFTEPSMEVDIQCSWKDGQVKIGEGDSWLEILGSGMVHPHVIKSCGLDPEKYQGFALGMGIDRIAMLKYGIPDLRAFFESDLRWLRHYGFKSLQVPTLAGGLS